MEYVAVVGETRRTCRVLETKFFWELRRSCTDDINMELGKHTLLLSWDIDVCMSGS